MLKANDYQGLAMRTKPNLDNFSLVRNAAYGMCGESGEVIDILKKIEFQGHEFDIDKLIDETGDVLWYCAEMAEGLGVTLEEIMVRNVEKLTKRYPNGFDTEKSINREEYVCESCAIDMDELQQERDDHP